MTWIFEIIARAVLPFITMYFEKRAVDEQARKDYLTFLEIAERNQLMSVEKRLKAVDQIDRVKEMWEKENANR